MFSELFAFACGLLVLQLPHFVTVEHLLLRYSDQDAARRILMDCLEDTGIMSKYKGITESLLLAPPCDNDIGKKDNYDLHHQRSIIRISV